MKKNYLIFSLLLGLLVTFNSHSQVYSSYGSTPSNDDYNYINNTNDTMYYTFNALPSGIYEDAALTIDGGSYFYPGGSYTIYGPGLVVVGNFTNSNYYNCNEFSVTVTIPMADIAAYGGSVVYKFVKQGSVNPYCSNNRLRTKLQYYYCPTGVPVQQASLSMTDHTFCQSEGSINLTEGSPAGGTYTGTGITNNTLDVSALPSGVYSIIYTLTEANGCYTQDSTTFSVVANPANTSSVVCQDAPIMNTGTISTVYATDLSLSNVIGTGTNVTLPPITSNPTYVYSAIVSSPFTYVINSLDTSNAQTVDHDALSGDDHGGIAVTANYVYIIGDDATARFNLDLDLQSGVSLPKRDGMFTDLAQLKMYTLYSTVAPYTPDYDNLTGFTMNALRSLNEDLTFGDEVILLSQPITMGVQSQGIILAGHNELIVGTANANYDFYHISISNGLVTPMGQHHIDVQGSESWSDWGMSGFDGTDRHGYFRDGNDSIVDFNFTTNTSTSITPITDFSDMASFIAHPLNHRFYGHYEGGTTTFGGNSETLFYFQISDTALQLTGTSDNYGCPNKITLTFNAIDLGADTTVCSEDGLYIVPGGFGYDSYTWNGVNNNFNSYPVQNSGEIVLSVVDDNNCTLVDSVNVTIVECTAGIDELGDESMMIYPVPNNGTFQIVFKALTNEAQIIIVDAQGKQIANKSVSQGETIVDMNLDVEPGIYFVRLNSENGTSQRSISIQ